MRRLLDLRIVRWELKLAYVVGVWLIRYPIAAALSYIGVPQLVVGFLVGTVMTLAGIVLGARVFRGKGELVEPPRPAWKMTAQPTLSRRLGNALVVLAVLNVLAIVKYAFEIDSAGGVDSLISSIDLEIFTIILAVLYRRSAVRLKRAGVLPLDPEFKPAKVKLK